ncbi:MAG: ParB/RepB/Spo0J family partition protein [Planctomycetes bacterium]|nr:ParB/RepB/Spo0J family partition protein [Planctomycetota bacterium]
MKKTERMYVELDLASIVGAKENLRDTVPWLSQLGYGMFHNTKDKPMSLVSMALSDDAQEQAGFVALIDEKEPGIKELADNMTTTGQLEPIRVRPTDQKGEYDLVFGARRMLARMYIYAKSAGKVPARLTAEIAEHDGRDALYASISENIRAEPSPIDDARSYDRLKKSFNMTAGEIADATGKGVKAVRTRLKLLRLPKELQEKVHLGKIGVERAIKHFDGKDQDDQTDKDRRKAPSLAEIRRYYSAPQDDLPDEIRPLITEEVRQLFAYWLGLQYEPCHEEQVV